MRKIRDISIGDAGGFLQAIALIWLCAAPVFAATPEPVPNSMAALGDSITRAFSDCKAIFDCPDESWSTGGDPVVDSQYQRLLTINPAIEGRTYNVAVSGSRVATLKDEAAVAILDGVDYMTILIGANDACADTVDAMTPVTTFRADFKQAMDLISTTAPGTRVFVASIPDLYRQWQLASPIPHARAYWSLTRLCQSMLARPLSKRPADEARRQSVLQRVIDYNAQLRDECALHAHCQFDGNAVFNHKFSPADLGTVDYFHPSLAGQALLARVTWRAGFGW